MQRIRTITLDLDDTLWAIEPVIVRAEQKLYDWLESHYPRITEQFSAEALLEVRTAVWNTHQHKRHDLTFMRRAVLAHIGHAAGYGDAYVDDAMQVFHTWRNSVELFPEVRPALAALGERFALVAVTNGNADLDAIGIGDLFHEVVTARSAGVAKPARRIFEAAVSAGGAKPWETLHVGDHPKIDVKGAQEAGLRAAWVNRLGEDWPRELAPPDVTVSHVGELPGLLAEAAE